MTEEWQVRAGIKMALGRAFSKDGAGAGPRRQLKVGKVCSCGGSFASPARRPRVGEKLRSVRGFERRNRGVGCFLGRRP